MTIPPRAQRVTLDRITEDTAVLETEAGQMIERPRAYLPPGAQPGDILEVTEGEDGLEQYRLLPETTQQARAEAEARIERLRERDPGGDIEL